MSDSKNSRTEKDDAVSLGVVLSLEEQVLFTDDIARMIGGYLHREEELEMTLCARGGRVYAPAVLVEGRGRWRSDHRLMLFEDGTKMASLIRRCSGKLTSLTLYGRVSSLHLGDQHIIGDALRNLTFLELFSGEAVALTAALNLGMLPKLKTLYWGNQDHKSTQCKC